MSNIILDEIENGKIKVYIVKKELSLKVDVEILNRNIKKYRYLNK